MDNLFLFVCFALMSLMIFGVVLYYTGFVHPDNSRYTFLMGILAILITSVVWILMGYSLSFYGNLQVNLFNIEQQVEEIPNMMVQLLFCLYAIVMLAGSILERASWKYFISLVPLWLLSVYAPICFFIWGHGADLLAFSVIDYSGGLVVHITAGVGSLVLAKFLPFRQLKLAQTSYPQMVSRFLGMLFITLGWFAFNMAPAGELTETALLVWLNTIIVIVVGGLAWFITDYFLQDEYSLTSVFNGMITGLVGSTASVGYVEAWESALIALAVGIICPILINQVNRQNWVDDATDSFGMNAGGGMIGSLLAGVFAFEGQYWLHQTLIVAIVVIWSAVMVLIIHWILLRLMSNQEPASFQNKGLDFQLHD
jgi:Amt family ammonium transporter